MSGEDSDFPLFPKALLLTTELLAPAAVSGRSSPVNPNLQPGPLLMGRSGSSSLAPLTLFRVSPLKTCRFVVFVVINELVSVVVAVGTDVKSAVTS